jgi:regulator of protease activity HflC (stomatin/prohibitin superfamily)
MSAADVLSAVYFVTAIFAILFALRLRKIPRTYITDYMRGVQFVKGLFVEVLGPGGYQPLTHGVKIEVVDMRPVPVILDSIAYRDALQNDSVVSIGAEILVSDPYLASTSLKNRIDDSLPIVRDTLRTVISRGIADTSPEYRSKTAEDITGAVNDELRRMGMKISSVEITELFSRSAAPRRVTTGLN